MRKITVTIIFTLILSLFTACENNDKESNRIDSNEKKIQSTIIDNENITLKQIDSNDVEMKLFPDFGYVITPNDTLYTWGENSCIGNGNHGSETPIKIMENVKKLVLPEADVPYRTNAVITNNHELYIWGIDPVSQEQIYTPTKIMDNVSDVQFGIDFEEYDISCIAILTTNGEVYTYGINYNGQLGNGSEINSTTSELTKILDNIKQICISEYSSMALSNDGTLYTWGGGKENSVPISTLVDIKNINSGYFSDYCNGAFSVITTNDELYVQGYRESEFEKIADNIQDVYMLGDAYGFCLSNDNILYYFNKNKGFNDEDIPLTEVIKDVKSYYVEGRDDIAIVSTSNGIYRCKKTESALMTDEFEAIEYKHENSVYGDYQAFLNNSSELYIWGGNNDFGQLGNGTTEPLYEPNKLMTDVICFDIGQEFNNGGFAGAITSNGDFYTWGMDNEGILGNGELYDTLVPTKIMNVITEEIYN